jgi:hypothetical protein
VKAHYKGRFSAKLIERDFPHIVEVVVPPGGLGTKLDAMYAFHTQHGIGRPLCGQHHQSKRGEYPPHLTRDLPNASYLRLTMTSDVHTNRARKLPVFYTANDSRCRDGWTCASGRNPIALPGQALLHCICLLLTQSGHCGDSSWPNRASFGHRERAVIVLALLFDRAEPARPRDNL